MFPQGRVDDGHGDRRAILPRGIERAAFVAVLLPLAAGGTRAQEPRPSTLPPVGVELVQVDVVVTDKQGRSVSGLNALDFEVKEDGKTQTLSYFGVESRAEPGAEPPVPAPPAKGLPPDVLPPPPLPASMRSSGRPIVVLIDDLHIAPTNLVAAGKALKRFVNEQLAADDEVALVTTSGTVGLTQELTRDREALLRSFDRLSLTQQRRVKADEAPYLTEYEAELIDRGDPDAIRLAVQEVLQDNPDQDEALARIKVQQRAHSMLFEILDLSGQSLRAVEAVVRGLGQLPGRKIVVILSDGFLIGLGANDTRHYDLRRVVDAATRSGVVLYSLDTRGLASELPGGDVSIGGTVIRAPGVRESLQIRSIEALRDSLFALSEDTGGFLAFGSNDLNAGLGRILSDSRLYYLLAYEPTNQKRDGKFRKIQVRLRNRPELRLRTRTGYYAQDERKPLQATVDAAETPEARRDRELAQALASVLPLRGVPVRLVVDYVEAPPAGSMVVVNATLDVSSVGFERHADHYAADLDVAGGVFDESGQRVAEIVGASSRLKLPFENFQALRQQGLAYERIVPVPPGTYLVKLAARESRSGLLGSASEWVQVGDRNAQPLSLSSIFLKADQGPTRDGEEARLVDIQVDKRLDHRQGLHYLVYVYRPDADAERPARASVQAQVWEGEKLRGVGPIHSVAFPVDKEAPPLGHAERIALDSFSLGPYQLRIVATGENGDKVTRRLYFMVE